MEGFEHKPFRIQEKEINRIPKEPIKIVKELPKSFAQRLEAELDKKKKQKELSRVSSEVYIHHPVAVSVAKKPIIVVPKPKIKFESEKEKKQISWKKLGSITYKDIVGIGKFDPSELIAYQEDDEYYMQILSKFGKNSMTADRPDKPTNNLNSLNTPQIEKNSMDVFSNNIVIKDRKLN